MIICKICNPHLEGNGYCTKHSTGGTSYMTSKPKNIIDMEKRFVKLIKKYTHHIQGGEWFELIDGFISLENFITQELKAQREELINEISKWGRKMMDKKVPLKEMGENPEDDGWYDYDEITSSIISHIRYDEKGNLKNNY